MSDTSLTGTAVAAAVQPRPGLSPVAAPSQSAGPSPISNLQPPLPNAPVAASCEAAEPSALGPQPSAIPTPPLQPSARSLPPSESFPRLPGETPRAYAAFLAFFELGTGRSLLALAEQSGEKHDTLKCWSSRHRWSHRLQAFNAGLFQEQAAAQTDLHRQHAADWARRTAEFREQEWAAGQKLLDAARCFLDGFGDREVERMTLGQVSRALQISTRLAHDALRGERVPEVTVAASLRAELEAALSRAYGQPLDQNPSSPERAHPV